MSHDTTWFWQIVDARGLADVSSDEFVALNELISKAERAEAAESALTAAEAERDRLLDPVAIHANMLRGTIAKPSLNNIAHLYPEVQQMRQALIATLKHFRHPTSAEHETRDKVEAALSHFDAPPLTPYFAALSTAKERGE